MFDLSAAHELTAYLKPPTIFFSFSEELYTIAECFTFIQQKIGYFFQMKWKQKVVWCVPTLIAALVLRTDRCWRISPAFLKEPSQASRDKWNGATVLCEVRKRPWLPVDGKFADLLIGFEKFFVGQHSAPVLLLIQEGLNKFHKYTPGRIIRDRGFVQADLEVKGLEL